MTIGTTSSSITDQGNGVNVTFAYQFLIPQASDAVVIYTTVNGVQSTLSPAQYTFTGANNPAGGTVTYPITGSPIPSGASITIQRVLPLIQATSISLQGPTFAAIEGALDYLTMLIQGVQGQVDRAIVVNPADPPFPTPLPVAHVRANQFLYFDSNGQPTAASAISGTVVVSAAMQPVVGAATTETAMALMDGVIVLPTIAALRTHNGSSRSIWVAGYYANADGGEGMFVLQSSDTTSADNGGTIIIDALGGRWYRELGKLALSLRSFGAHGNGVADDTTAIQNAFNWVTSTYDSLGPSPGNYNISSPLTLLPRNVVDPNSWPGPEINLGQRTIFVATFSMPQMLTVGGNASNNSQLAHDWRVSLGTWDCNRLASVGILIAYAANCVIRDTQVRNFTLHGYEAGSAGSPISSYGIYFEDCYTYRDIRYVNISNITKASTAVVTTATAHGLTNGMTIYIQNVSGMIEVNNNYFVVAGVSGNTFQLNGINSTGYSNYTFGGTVSPCDGTGTVGIFYNNSTDMVATNCVLTGAQIGISANVLGTATSWGVYDGKFVGIHVWNYAENCELLYGFDCWANTHYIGCQVDTPFQYAWHFRELGNSLVACQVDYGSYASFPAHAYVFLIEIGGGGSATSCSWVDVHPENPLAAEAIGDLSHFESFQNAVSNVTRFGSQGVNIVSAWGYFAADGTMLDGYGVESTTHNGAGDYTMVTNNRLNAYASITVNAVNTGGSPIVAYEDYGQRTDFGFRVLFCDLAGTPTDPATFSVQITQTPTASQT